jgi:hypothetical protein
MAHPGGDCHVLFGKGPADALRLLTGVNSDAETCHAGPRISRWEPSSYLPVK